MLMFWTIILILTIPTTLTYRILSSSHFPSQQKSCTLHSTEEDYSNNIMNTYGRFPLVISHGNGVVLFDNHGNEYLDFAAGIATCCLGHNNEELKKAVCAQMGRVHHCSNLYYIPEQAALAKWLVTNSCADKVFFCNSGAEANEGAIKLTRKYAHTRLQIENPVIITAINSFHGRTLTALTATGQPKYQKDFGPLTPGFEYAEYNNLQDLTALVHKINSQKGTKVAGIMMEALQGEGGVKPGKIEFFKGIRQLCDETGALMIIDEVQTGMGRTGKLWGYQQLDVEPDIFTTAKALGGGVPIGAMLCKEKFMVFQPGDHASTYGGNPLACAAGLAVAKVIEEENLVEKVEERGRQLREAAKSIQQKYPHLIGDVRGWGLINGVQLTDTCPFTAADVTKKLMSSGVLVVPAGPNVIRFVPPLIVSKSEIDLVMDKFSYVISQLSSVPLALQVNN